MSATLTPGRSLEQRLAALAQANWIRVERSKLKHRLKSGQTNPADLIADPPSYAMSMKVEAFLLALPKFGRVKAQRLLREGLISTAKTIGGLSTRQRQVLIDLLETRP